MIETTINYSVIIPAYFSSGFITELLSTIPGRNDIEVIVVDDSSDSGEYVMLRKVVKNQNKQARVVKNVNKKGVCGARNTGLSHASGKWIIFADSDDVFYTKELSDKMNEYSDTDYDQVLFRYDSKMAEGEGIAGRHKHADFIFQRYRKSSPLVVLLNTGTVYMRFIKRSLVISENIKFRDEYKIAEDAIFVTEVTSQSKKYTLDEAVLYTVRDRTDSVTRKMDYDLFKNWIDAQKMRNTLVQKIPNDFNKKSALQTKLVILLKALNQLGIIRTIRLNRYVKLAHIPLVRSDEVIFLVKRLWRQR